MGLAASHVKGLLGWYSSTTHLDFWFKVDLQSGLARPDRTQLSARGDLTRPSARSG